MAVSRHQRKCCKVAALAYHYRVHPPGDPLTDQTHYRFVIADDHPLFRGALREAVGGLFEHIEIAEAGTFEEVSKLLDAGSDIDLILLDLSMPGVRGFSGLMYLRAQYPSVPIVIVSASDEPSVIRRCMDFGASGFIPKTLPVEAMRGAIHRLAAAAGARRVAASTRLPRDLRRAVVGKIERPTPPAA